jgi:hypothetical protein
VNDVVSKDLGKKYGDNMNWYFDQVLYGSNVCDYKLASISNTKKNGSLGIYDSSGVKKFLDGTKSDKTVYKSKVTVYRLGEVKLPIEVLVHFENGKELHEIWNGQDRSVEFKYEGESKIIWAKIDPENKIPLDVNLINNSLTTESENGVFHKYTAKIFFWLENTMMNFSALF